MLAKIGNYKFGFWFMTALYMAILVLFWVVLFRLHNRDTQLQQATTQLVQANQGDLNHDGKVNVSDLSILAHHYGKKDQL